MVGSSALVLLLCSALASAAPTVSVLPANNSVFAGEEFEISVDVNADAGDLSCFSISVSYDPLLLEIVSSSEGSLFAASPDPTFYQQEQESYGVDIFSDCVLGFGTGVVAPGELLRVRFKALTSGTSGLDMLQVQLRDLDRALIGGIVPENGVASISLTATRPAGLGPTLRLSSTPNPSSGAVVFRLASEQSNVGQASELLREDRVELYDVSGRRLQGLQFTASDGGLRWNARDAQGRRLASGIYFVVLREGGAIIAKSKLLLLD